MKIKFGTDGWRAIIADGYTFENVRRVAEGTGRFMQEQGMEKVVIGYDCRFQGQAFSELVAGVLGSMGIQVVLNNATFVSTPMVSYAVHHLKADLGIVITASHNPPTYSGFKLKSRHGGPSIPAEVAAVEDRIPDAPVVQVLTLEELEQKKLLHCKDLESIYIDKVRDSFDLQAIHDSGLKIAYDAMYGAGQRAVRRLFPDAHFLHCEHNPSFHGQAPEPIDRNLQELAATIRNNPGQYDVGLAHDGDADRIGMYDENGNFVDSHHILLLLLEYLYQYKKIKEKVIVTFSVTNKVKQLAEMYGLDVETTKVGFKYIAQRMQETDILVAGEESGGIAVTGYIPERDGIWIALVIFEYMAKSGQSLTQLIQNIYDKVGPFTFDRDDLHISSEKKEMILEHLRSHPVNQFGDRKIAQSEDLDGFKYTLDNGDWVMIRPSGTEPVLRVYAQSESRESVKDLLNTVHDTLHAIES
ncbi:phosphoglucomutase/phosphomannomutase family protein [Membranicola marinus]|uniref:Phosphoglucomutase/phosphomannomutase family protein n=1 Tax=Membranihabitans marinus TaxID=1227546 RepID=A0A953HZU2_9BACT|nr:phosphoglucomutase/phosphomannomutase family protein [Membranihabitans marinus]MBY5958712.1 phosphoglucomutase/phosphomannomutase family protein [Membranihabitans marinus]